MRRLLGAQCGVVARAQLEGAGWSPADLERAVRRRELARLLPGVYVDHTGAPTWLQQAWAATLATSPSVLDGLSALRAWEWLRGRQDGHPGPIEIATHVDRSVRPPSGVRVVRRRGLAERALWNGAPPRLLFHDAVVQVALDAGSDLDAFGVLSDAVGGRRTSPGLLRDALGRRSTRPLRSRWLARVLDDVAAGTCSVLELEYLARVVRPHGLPVGNRQARGGVAGRTCFRDVDLPAWGVVVELDGRLHHGSATQRDRDLERDLEAAATQRRVTLRMGYWQVHERPCRTAALQARVLVARGWRGPLRSCSPTCEASAVTALLGA